MLGCAPGAAVISPAAAPASGQVALGLVGGVPVAVAGIQQDFLDVHIVDLVSSCSPLEVGAGDIDGTLAFHQGREVPCWVQVGGASLSALVGGQSDQNALRLARVDCDVGRAAGGGGGRAWLQVEAHSPIDSCGQTSDDGLEAQLGAGNSVFELAHQVGVEHDHRMMYTL